jgi:hypothetical protein
MTAPSGLDLAFGIGYLVGSILWARLYYRRLDPVLRRWLGGRLGVRVIWTHRTGGLHRGPLWFGPKYDTWSWSVGGAGEIESVKDGLVYAAWLLLVPVLAGLLPVAIFLIAFLGMGFPSFWVGYPLLFLIIPIYTRYWSGRYEVPGMRLPEAAEKPRLT